MMTSAEAFKSRGNAHFLAGKFDEAVNDYTKAVQASPQTVVYYTNRALCYVRLQQWPLVLADAEAAMALDGENIKAHYFMGIALIELKRYDEALKTLKTAMLLSHSGDVCYSEEIARQTLRVRKLRWEQMDSEREEHNSELLRYLSRLIEEDRQRQLSNISEAGGASEIQVERDVINRTSNDRLNDVKELFAQADEKFKKREVPEYLLGNIDFEIMRDPMIAPSGITYERTSILEHLRRVGHFDPITRSKLAEHQLIPNLALKSVIDDFLDRNGWAASF